MTDTTTCTNIFGHTVTVFANDNIGRKIARQGLFEKDALEFLLDLLGGMPGACVLDVGANIGNHTLAFATTAARVHAFEPIPAIHDILQCNVTDNSLDNVSVHPYALSDTDGEATIHMTTDGNIGASSFDQRDRETSSVTVPIRRGDTLLPTLGIDRVDMIKIDVEAHEVFVLRGLMQTLEQQRPVITMEWNDPLTIERFQGSAELAFLQAEYHIHVLGCNHDRLWWQGRALAWPRRKFAKHFTPRKAVLYPFHPGRLYDNLLLIPRGREALLRPLLDKYDHQIAP